MNWFQNSFRTLKVSYSQSHSKQLVLPTEMRRNVPACGVLTMAPMKSKVFLGYSVVEFRDSQTFQRNICVHLQGWRVSSCHLLLLVLFLAWLTLRPWSARLPLNHTAYTSCYISACALFICTSWQRSCLLALTKGRESLSNPKLYFQLEQTLLHQLLQLYWHHRQQSLEWWCVCVWQCLRLLPLSVCCCISPPAPSGLCQPA